MLKMLGVAAQDLGAWTLWTPDNEEFVHFCCLMPGIRDSDEANFKTKDNYADEFPSICSS